MTDYTQMGLNQIPGTWCDTDGRLPFVLQEQTMRTAKNTNKVNPLV